MLVLPALAHGEPRGWADDGYTGETAHQRAARHEAHCVRKLGDGMTLSSHPRCFGVLREHVLQAIATLDVEAAAQRATSSRVSARRLAPLKEIPTAPWYFGQAR